MTPEEMQAEILRLQEENNTLKAKDEQATNDNGTLKTRITELQEHNQKLFLKLTSQSKDVDKPEDKKPETCEEFATKIKL
jgi:hypothetical protein